jgi:hypothetical protein
MVAMEMNLGRGALGSGDGDPSFPNRIGAGSRVGEGLQVGGCVLHEVLGRGGMGTVYRATQVALDREVAVKLVAETDASPSLVERFKREVRAAAALEHPCSVPVYAAGEEDGLLYLAMRLVDGCDLRTLIAREGPLAPERAVAIVEQIAGALDAAHDAGLVHRDVKPGNVLLEDVDGEEHAFLSDFGLMRDFSDATAITRTGEWAGSVDYASPEQLEGRPVDLSTDVYALAGVLYTALSGERPFPRETVAAVALAHVNAPVPSLPPGSRRRGLNGVISRGMAKRPRDRFATAGDLARAARAAVKARRRRSRVALAAAVIVVAACAGGAIALMTSDTDRHGQRKPLSSSQAQYTGAGERFSYPAGWRLVEADHAAGSFYRTSLVSPDGAQMLIVDRTPGDRLSPAARAAAVTQATSQTPGYALISLRAATIGGRPAEVWTFRLPGGERVDVFVRVGNDGFAVLGEAPLATSVAPAVFAAAKSLRAR